MNESELHRVYNYPIYPTESKINSDKGFVHTVDGSRKGTDCFLIKVNKFYYFDSFGGAPDNFLLEQLPKQTVNNNYKIQDNNWRLCGSYCFYFF